MPTTTTATARRKTDASGDGSRNLPGTVIWIALCAAVAMLAVGVQLDRSARRDARMVSWVPSWAKGYALETEAQLALARGDSDRGLELSRELVRRRPIPAEGLSLYTRALLATGHQDEAVPALTLAAQRGWRDRYTQNLMVLVAAQNADWPTATQRLIAIWRQGRLGDEALQLSRSVLSEPGAMRAFASQFVPADTWVTQFLGWGALELPSNQAIAAAGAAARHRVQIDCAHLSRRLYDLTRTGRAAVSATLWNSVCVKGAGPDPHDFSFGDAAEGNAGPLDWRYPEAPDLSVDLRVEAGRTVLRYENTAPLRVVIAERFALLAPGIHTLKADAGGNQGLLFGVTCFRGPGQPYPLGKFKVDGNGASFSIPDDCRSQRFQVLAGRESGEFGISGMN